MESASHIVPVLRGRPVHTKLVSDMLLLEHGVYVQPINYPDRAEGHGAAAVHALALHDDAMMDTLVAAMDALWSRCNVARRPVAA
jgi:5-aminolevulinate synthase